MGRARATQMRVVSRSLRVLKRFWRQLPRPFVPEIVVHGRHTRKWNEAFEARSKIWDILVPAGLAQPETGTPRPWRKRVVVPLIEPHVASTPFDCYALVPDPRTLAILSDKAEFARHAGGQGLAHLLPRTLDLAEPTFPAVLKPTNLCASVGVAVVRSQAELDEKLATSPWSDGQVLLQEAVASLDDRVTHLVCVRGRIVWHRTYTYGLDGPDAIRPIDAKVVRRDDASSEDLAAFESLLMPLGYDGPANIDYRRRADGSLAIFEINPRLGGSMMRKKNAADLAACLAVIVKHARWRPSPSAEPVAVREEVPA